jgi:thiamine-monophosphate kinase
VKHGPSNTPASLAGTRGEREIIAAIRARLPAAPPWLTVPIGDDAAVAVPERGALEILTTDALVEGVHFDRRFSSPSDIGWKALAVNLSDIAAMGGTPRLALLSLGLPESMSIEDVDAMVDGFLALASEARVTLAGGNITRSPGPLFVDVTVTGFARRRHILTRAGAQADDDLYVTGEIGAAAAGLAWLHDGREGHEGHEGVEGVEGVEAIEGIEGCARRHRRPQPRVRAGTLLGRNRAARACMDLSDGLADAVRQIAEASGLGARIDGASLPIPPSAREWFLSRGEDPVVRAAEGGDDYELLFAATRRARGRIATVERQARGLRFTRIGVMTPDRELVLVDHGRELPLPRGFVHFS